jgi:hypothetical protein
MPTKVFTVLKGTSPINLKLFKHLRVMYFMGYLPISWRHSEDPNCNEGFFKNSRIKSALMFLFDVAVSINTFAFFYVWHLLNMDKDFDSSSIFKLSYLLGVYDGVVTTALTQFLYMFLPTSMFWLYTFMGEHLQF